MFYVLMVFYFYWYLLGFFFNFSFICHFTLCQFKINKKINYGTQLHEVLRIHLNRAAAFCVSHISNNITNYYTCMCSTNQLLFINRLSIECFCQFIFVSSCLITFIAYAQLHLLNSETRKAEIKLHFNCSKTNKQK